MDRGLKLGTFKRNLIRTTELHAVRQIEGCIQHCAWTALQLQDV